MSTLRGGVDDDGMGERTDGVPDRADLDPVVLVADDRLLDALGRGDPAPAGDPLARLLSAWRADLDADRHEHADAPVLREAGPDAGLPPAPRADLAAGPRPGPSRTGHPRPRASAGRSRNGGVGGRLRPGVPADLRRPDGLRPGVPVDLRRPDGGPRAPRTRPGAAVRRLVLSTAAAVVTTALFGLGVNHAGPTSPLWPVAAAVYPDRSTIRAAEHTIQLAREAAEARRFDEARQELDRAAGQVAGIHDPGVAARLFSEIARIRLGLPEPAERPETPTGERSGPARPGPPTPAPEHTPPPRRTAGEAPPPTARSGAAQPPPASPTARQVLPLPVPVLPSLLPSGLPLLPSGGCVLLCPPD
ncbi:hypothetical protein ACN27G_14455 [Plantactinospora sp. WMMB334]|uniref:hypothetical protein n=1 Tax=Plantactinospora sp. WMMB334 TaxID=3404119 RepID=UPI003B965B12